MLTSYCVIHNDRSPIQLSLDRWKSNLSADPKAGSVLDDSKNRLLRNLIFHTHRARDDFKKIAPRIENTIAFKTYADGYSREVSTSETFKCHKNRPTSPALKQCAMNYAFQCFISGLAAPSMFLRWTKSSILKASSRPPFGSVQSRFVF